jgi:type IV pilus assembly protein PilV
MLVHPVRSPHDNAHQGGFTLIEVLIAMLLLLIGLLGVAQLHFSSFQENRNALYRNQATVIAEDLIDRVRSNPTGLANGFYDDLSFDGTSTAPAAVNCSAAGGCTPQQLAGRDAHEWARNFVPGVAGYVASLPSAAGTGDANPTSAACPGRIEYLVSVTWLQPNGDRAAVEMGACL